jgi:putative endonuclease
MIIHKEKVNLIPMKLGDWAEQQARIILENSGFKIIETNYHSRYGEIDLIARTSTELVFVEVKARSSTKYGCANEVISISKQKKIMKTALQYLSDKPEMSTLYCRFDAICFDFYKQFAKTVQHDFSQFTYDLNWIENAFTFEQEFINL